MVGTEEGRVTIVTGGASGIGLAVARCLVEEGGRVVLAGRDANRIDAAVDELGSDRCEGVVADVSEVDDNARIVARAHDRFGRIDSFVANAGISLPLHPIEELPVDAFDRIMAINVRGVFLGLRAAIPAIRAGGRGGSIVTVASIAGIKARGGGNAAYVATKHAVVGLTKTAAVECGPHGIRVNCVLPGPTDTAMIQGLVAEKSRDDAAAGKAAILAGMPLGRFGLAEEVARLIVFLASDRASFSTGGIHAADGGFSAV